jgi:hypothetical protein
VLAHTLTFYSYAGNLTFTFSNDLQITIPNHQLVIPDISIDISGNTVFNSSTREVMLNSLQASNADDMPMLGMTFLTSAYLSVNHDRGTFSLWQANPTTDKKLIGIGQNSNGCLGAATNTTSVTSSPSPSHKPSPSPISAGAIAGVVVVAAVALTAIVVGCLYMRRKTKRNRVRRKAALGRDFQMETPPLMQHEQVNGNDWYGKSELAGDNQKASYTDQDPKSVPGVPPNSHPYKTHSLGSTMTPHELEGS